LATKMLASTVQFSKNGRRPVTHAARTDPPTSREQHRPNADQPQHTATTRHPQGHEHPTRARPPRRDTTPTTAPTPRHPPRHHPAPHPQGPQTTPRQTPAHSTTARMVPQDPTVCLGHHLPPTPSQPPRREAVLDVSTHVTTNQSVFHP